jgi:tetratricopeptide (TPR) repeat protein
VRGSDLAHAWALYVGAGLAESQSDHAEARRMFEACLELRRKLGNPVDIAATLSTLTLARLQSGDIGGAEQSELEALGIFREVGDKLGEAICLVHLGQVCQRAGKDGEARARLQEGLRVAEQIKNKEAEGECRLVLGELAYEAGVLSDAEASFERSLVVCREAADKRGEANATRWLGKCDGQQGRVAGGLEKLRAALRAYVLFEMWEELLGCLDDIAELMAVGDRQRAARLLSAVAQARDRLQLPRTPKEDSAARERLGALRKSLGDALFIEQWERGEALDIREAIAQALATDDEPALAA